MDYISRFNLQRGVSENKKYTWTDYTPTNSLDNFILQKISRREQLQERKYKKDLEDQIEKEIEKKIVQVIEKSLKF